MQPAVFGLNQTVIPFEHAVDREVSVFVFHTVLYLEESPDALAPGRFSGVSDFRQHADGTCDLYGRCLLKRKQIAVCDREQDYTLRFTEYANRRRDPVFTVHGFTSCKELADYAEEHPMDVLLISEELSSEIGEKGCFEQIFYLSEEEYQEEKAEYPRIYKFQSCPQVMRTVLSFYADQTAAELGTALRQSRMKQIGIYSPVGRIGKTSFALALGRELSKQKRTLYLNLEEYSGFSVLYPYGDGWTLSELMYFLKQGKNAFACKLESIVRRMGNLDYIPPLKSPVELRHISRKDWESLLEALGRESQYEILILDMSGAVNGLFELLGRCDGVYTPIREDEVSGAKLCQYEETLRLLDLEEVLEKTKKFWLFQEEDLDAFIRAEGKRWIEL